MKRFARLLLVTVGFGVLGLVMSLVPQKNATGAAGATVTVMNPPANPVPILATEDLARHSFTVAAVCNVFTFASATACSPANLLTVADNQVAVVREINANCTGTTPLAGFVSVTFSNGQGVAFDFAMDASVPHFLVVDKETSLVAAPSL